MFLKVGHRGAKAYETENTLASFQRAIELGANAVELDVRKTKDGKLVVIHDDTLKRVFGEDISVSQATLKKLKQVTDGRLPALDEALRFIDGKVEKILVELKEIGDEKKVLETVTKEGLQDRVIVVSFHEDALWEVRGLNRTIETGLIYAKHKSPVAAALKLDARYIVPLYRIAHTRTIEDAHSHNLKVVVWTINTKKEVAACKAKGVDGIASDKPDIL
ncbi:MAG: glycerophosphodiester phosphodiesterase [Nitrospirota bacterium]